MAKRILIFSTLIFLLLIPAVYGMMRWYESLKPAGDSFLEFTLLFCTGTGLVTLLLALVVVIEFRQQRLQGQVWTAGKTASARVVEVRNIRTLPGGLIADVELLLEISPYDREAFSGRVDAPVCATRIPHPGQVITVKFGPIFRRRIILEKPLDEQLDPLGDAGNIPLQEYFYPSAKQDDDGRLHRLGDLRRIGALSAVEYREGRRKCLQSGGDLADGRENV